MRVALHLNGTTPLVVHNIQLADPENEWTRAIRELTSKRKKTQEDQAEIARLEFQGGLYFSDSLGVVFPTKWILRSLNEAGKATKEGRTVQRGVILTSLEVPLDYQGPRDRDGLWSDGRFAWRTVVGVQRARTVRVRPKFSEWATSVEVELFPDLLDLSSFERIAQRAGLIEGVGDARTLGYGRFEAKVEEL